MSEFKDMKFRVDNAEHSEAIQEVLFKLGYSWRNGESMVSLTDKPFLFAYKSGSIYYWHEADYFESHQHEEYKLVNGDFIKATEEKEVDTIKLTYAEAWEKLKEGKEVFYKDYPCNSGSIICFGNQRIGVDNIVPFHSTDKFFTMKKEPDYEVLGLHDNYVEIEVFGLKAYQEKGTSSSYHVKDEYLGSGFVCTSVLRYIGRVKLKGDSGVGRIRVTVDKDGIITYEHI